MTLSSLESRSLVIIGVMALVLRLFYVFSATSQNTLTIGKDDDGDHINFARRLVLEDSYSSVSVEPDKVFRAWRPPLFILFVTGVFKLHGYESFLAARIYLCVLSLLIPLSAWRLSRNLWGETAGLVAFAWSAFHPSFLYYAAHVQADSLFVIVATVATVQLLVQKKFWHVALSGLLVGLACLGRSSFFGMVLIGAAWTFYRSAGRLRFTASLLFLGMVVTVFSPWWIRNYRLFHTFVPFSTEGGFTLWVGNNPLADGGGDCPPSPAPKELSELARDQWHYQEAVRYMKDHPGRTARLALSKISRFWAVVPRVRSATVRWISFFSYMPLFIFAAVGFVLARAQWRQLLPIYALSLYYSFIHSIFPTVMRYRLPLEPLLISVASFGVISLFQRRGRLEASG